jgi:DNA-binding MarR family transcriptional regulator
MHSSRLPSLDCLCAGFRRSARALTQLYEGSLRPLGLRASQFTILQGQLAEILAMDSTTLTRTLKIMLRQGWVAERRGEDRRERRFRLSKSGGLLLRRATPEWEKVQARLRRRLGAQTWETLERWTDQVTSIALNDLSTASDRSKDDRR